MLPATCIFVFAGYQVPTLAELERQALWDTLWPGPIVALTLLARRAAMWLGFLVRTRLALAPQSMPIVRTDQCRTVENANT